MRSRAAGLKMAEPARLGRLAHVKDKEPFGKRLTVGTAPAGRDALQRSDHPALGHLNLNCPTVFRSGNEGAELRRSRIRDIEHAPAAMPEVCDIEIPAVVDLLHRQLESRSTVQ